MRVGGCRLKIRTSLPPIGCLQLDTHEPPPHFERTVAFRTDAGEWRQYEGSGSLPQLQCSAYHRELKRADVLLVRVLPRTAILQRVAWVNIHPHGTRVLLPPLDGELLFAVRDRFQVLTGLAHRHEIVRNTLPTHRTVFADRLMQESERLGALHGGHGVFPDHNLAVVNPTQRRECANQLPAEVSQPDHAIPHFARGEIHAVE